MPAIVDGPRRLPRAAIHPEDYLMAQRRHTLMDPPIEDLLDKVDSKFTLVALGSKRARQINAYYNSLGEGLGSGRPATGHVGLGQAPLDRLRGDRGRKATYHPARPRGGRGSGRCHGRRRRGRPARAVERGEVAEVRDRWTSGTRTRQRATTHAEAGERPWPRTAASCVARPPLVVLGVSGGIAAYKAVEVCRRLVDAGVHVAPVLTGDATRFVGELTFSALASEPAQTALWNEASPIPHTRLGQAADLVVVAPATAHLLGALRRGAGRRPADRHAARHPRPGARLPGDAHRDVGAPGGAATTWRPCAPGCPWSCRPERPPRRG